MVTVNSFSWQTALRFISSSCVIAIIILSLLPGSERPHTGLPGQLEHAVAYAGTGFFLALRFQTLLAQAVVWTLMAAMSGLLEWLQLHIPGRDPKLIDAFASASGLALGLMLGVYGGKYLRRAIGKMGGETGRRRAPNAPGPTSGEASEAQKIASCG